MGARNALLIVMCCWLSSSAMLFVNGVYYVTPTASDPCTKKGPNATCFTLSQYATKPNDYFASNTTFVLLPGNHSLDSELHIANIEHFAIVASTKNHPSRFKVECSLNGKLSFANIDHITISDTEFFGCNNNTVTSVHYFNLKGCTFNAHGNKETTLVKLTMVTNAWIMQSYFSWNKLGLIEKSPVYTKVTGRAIIVNASNVFITKSELVDCRYGAILSFRSNVTIVDSTIANNEATWGGAIYHETGMITIENSVFSNNKAAKGGGAMYFLHCNVTVNNSQFAYNKVDDSDIATLSTVTSREDVGGGVMYHGESIVVVTNSVFTENSAIVGGVIMVCYMCFRESDIAMFDAVKIELEAYTEIWFSNSNLRIKSCVFTNNMANLYGSVLFSSHKVRLNANIENSVFFNNTALDSGTIHVLTEHGDITIDNSIYINNTASNDGGAIYLSGDNVKIKDTTFTRNSANFAGGVAVFSNNNVRIESTTFSQNVASKYGGALYISESDVTIKNGLFYNNAANSSSGAITVTDSNLTMDNTIFAQNKATSTGALSISNTTLKCVHVKFINNTAINSVGAIFADDYSNITIEKSIFAGNKAMNSYGSMFVVESNYFRLNNVLFSGNTAADCGAVYISGCKLMIVENCTFINNAAISMVEEAGAMSIYSSSVIINNSLFANNTASMGGALYTSSSSVTIENSTFYNNTATIVGGAMYSLLNRIVKVTNSLFVNNKANFNNFQWGGGAIFQGMGRMIAENSTFVNNAAMNGGVVDFRMGSISINKGTFVNNKAYNNGGAILQLFCDVSINESTFTGNTAGWGDLKSPTHDSNDTHILQGMNDISVLGGLRLPIIVNYSGGALASIVSELAVDSCKFINNTAEEMGGAVFSSSQLRDSTKLTYTIFTQNKASTGGAISVSNSFLYTDGYLLIENNRADLAAFYAAGSTVILNDFVFFSENYGSSIYGFSSNITFDAIADISNNSNTDNSHTTLMGGAVSCYQCNLLCKAGVDITYNSAGNKFGGAISITEGKLYAYETCSLTISNNVALNGGGIYAYQSELIFKGKSSIQYNSATNKGGGIYAISSTSKLSDAVATLQFVGNSAKKGGAMFLERNAKLYIMKVNYFLTGLKLDFIGNSAVYGGAIFVSDETSTGTCATSRMASGVDSECFLQALANYDKTIYKASLDFTNFIGSVAPQQPRNISMNIHFENNTATKLGMTLYGGLLDRCTVSPFAEVKYLFNLTLDSVTYMTTITNLQKDELEFQISSDPVRVCFCEDNISNCSYQPPVMHVRKGEMFTVSLVAVDHVNNTIPNSTILSYLSAKAGLREGQSIQTTGEGCTELQYAVTSPYISEQLHLYANGTCKDIGISLQAVNITFVSCPLGFKDTNSKCDCDPELLQRNYISNCSIDTESVLRRGNVWITFTNTSGSVHEGLVTYPNCPFDYCYPSTKDIWINLNIPNDFNKQCAFNHSGKLCGSCKDGLSLSLGSSRCVRCSNHWLVLLVFFIVAGVSLVVLLLVCNLTVAAGTVNGLLFYANIVSSNWATFFPSSTNRFFTVFIAWLNLDFGFETCFFNGLNGYWKTWLQLAFPAYIIILVVSIIKACEYSHRFARLIARKNPVAILATLVLLSYTKLLRTIISAWQFATLEYSDGTREVVWLVDANINYFELKHIPLFIAALVILLIVLIYTLLLFFWQWLLLCPNRHPVKWIRNSRLHAIMDAYFITFNKNHRYWNGLLLLARVLLYLVSTLNGIDTTDPRMNLFAIICVAGSLVMWKELTRGRIYRKCPLDTLDTSFLFNLLILAAATSYAREEGKNQTSLASISVGIAFVTFLLIISYHLYAYVLKNCIEKIKTKLFNHTDFRSRVQNIENGNGAEDQEDGYTVTEVNGLPQPLDTDEENFEDETLETDEGNFSSLRTSKSHSEVGKTSKKRSEVELQDFVADKICDEPNTTYLGDDEESKESGDCSESMLAPLLPSEVK